jgi:uncharacterized repeat protein (TIGR01451 family)
MKLPGMQGSTIQLRPDYTQDQFGICSDVRPERTICGAIIDNIVVNGVIAASPGRLRVSASAPATAATGQSIAYSIAVSNDWPSASVNARLTDTVPLNTNFRSLTAPAGWTCATPAVGGVGDITCENPSLAPGATATFTVVVRVNSGTPGNTVVSHVVQAISATVDGVVSRNAATVVTTVDPLARLFLPVIIH